MTGHGSAACLLALVVASVASGGCGDRSGAGNEANASGATRIEAPPAGAGELWVIDPRAGTDTSSAAAALTAFAWGMQTIVLDENHTWIGTRKIVARPDGAGTRVIRLSDALEATLSPAGEGMTLEFSNGQHVPMERRKTPNVRSN